MCSILDRKMPLKYVRNGQMIDRHSVVVFFRKTKWTERAITHEINCVIGENTISYSTLGNVLKCLPYQQKKQTLPSSPNRKVVSVLMTASPLCSQRSHFIQSLNY
jgi:hypothetical protein